MMYSLDIVSSNNRVIKISQIIDLKGDTLKIPDESVLEFDGGVILNGTLIGNNTKIKSDKKRIFRSIKILGTWNVDSIYTNWFDFSSEGDNYDNFQNLLALSHDSVINDIFFEMKRYYASKFNHLLKVKSNTTLHMDQSIIEILPNSDKHFSVISISGVKNVKILGGKLIGDLLAHKIQSGTTDEWNHGIQISGSEDVLVRNTISSYHMGDGVDIIDLTLDNKDVCVCKNIVLENVICEYNRRQAFSVEAVDGLVMRYCKGRYTGKIKYTAPALGLDIEPWRKEAICKNINIQYCEFTNNSSIDAQNNRIDVIIQPNHFHRSSDFIVNNISLSKCKLSGVLSAYYANGLNLDSLYMPNGSFIGITDISDLKLSNISPVRKVYLEKIQNAYLDSTCAKSFQVVDSHFITVQNSNFSSMSALNSSTLKFNYCTFNNEKHSSSSTSYIAACSNLDFVNCKIKQFINTSKCSFTRYSFNNCHFDLASTHAVEYRLHNVSNIENCIFDLPIELVIENSPSSSAIVYGNLWNNKRRKKVALRVHNNNNAKLYFLNNTIYDSDAAIGVDFGNERVYYCGGQEITPSAKSLPNLKFVQVIDKKCPFSKKVDAVRRHSKLGNWQRWDGKSWINI